MSSSRTSKARLLPSLLVLSALLFPMYPLRAQRPGGGTPPPASGQRSGSATSQMMSEQPVNLLVSVREPTGMPLAGFAVVNLSSQRGIHITVSTRDNSTATFQGVMEGEYDIEVNAEGYKTATEHASVLSGGTTYTVYIYLHNENEGTAGSAAPSGFLLTPRLQGEIDKGLDKMRRHQYDAARAQFEKAAKLAPGNPDIQYLLGMVEYTQEHFEGARGKFQAALSINPSHERSLLALGELQLRTGDPAGATQTLEKAYQLNGTDWRTHWLLANAYAQQKKYEKALVHATRATELGKEHAAPAWLLEGQIMLQLERREEARKAFETVARSFPNDPAVKEAKSRLAELDEAVITAVSQVLPQPETPPPPALALVAIRPWAVPPVTADESV